jgi:hypothetical protein
MVIGGDVTPWIAIERARFRELYGEQRLILRRDVGDKPTRAGTLATGWLSSATILAPLFAWELWYWNMPARGLFHG